VQLMNTTVLRGSFTEWLSPDFQGLQPLELWLLGLMVVGLGCNIKLPPLRLVFVLLLVHLSLQAMRHSDILAVLVPLLVSAPFGAQIKARLQNHARPLAGRLALLGQPIGWPALTATLLLTIAVGACRLSYPIERSDATAAPISALEAARRLSLSGPVFNAQVFGGYLMFEGVPTFIDGRAELYGADFIARYLQAWRGDEPALTALLDDYHVAWTLLDPHSGAALVLGHMPGWQQVYHDDFAVIDRRIAVPAP
ncbi:MAG TPA: hypothetical protein VGH13_16280, partial [Xanthobacteraceae bacterium]